MATWNQHLKDAAKTDVIIAKAPADESVWSREFDDDYGGSEGNPVLAWSEEYVYFPVVYDGSEWISSAPRHPRAEGQYHVGG